MKRCSECGKAIRPSQRFLEIGEGIPVIDGSGWAMKTLKRFHLSCTVGQTFKVSSRVLSFYSVGTYPRGIRKDRRQGIRAF